MMNEVLEKPLNKISYIISDDVKHWEKKNLIKNVTNSKMRKK